MHEQSEHFNKETANIKKYQTEIIGWKNTQTALKISTEGLSNGQDQIKKDQQM